MRSNIGYYDFFFQNVFYVKLGYVSDQDLKAAIQSFVDDNKTDILNYAVKGNCDLSEEQIKLVLLIAGVASHDKLNDLLCDAEICVAFRYREFDEELISELKEVFLKNVNSIISQLLVIASPLDRKTSHVNQLLMRPGLIPVSEWSLAERKNLRAEEDSRSSSSLTDNGTTTSMSDTDDSVSTTKQSEAPTYEQNKTRQSKRELTFGASFSSNSVQIASSSSSSPLGYEESSSEHSPISVTPVNTSVYSNKCLEPLRRGLVPVCEWTEEDFNDPLLNPMPVSKRSRHENKGYSFFGK
jgi:hypothetical protein